LRASFTVAHMRLHLAAFLFVATYSSNALADYASKGPIATTTTSLPSGFAGATGGKLVVPTAAGKYPLVIASHGWSASSANQVGWAELFGSYGFVVVAPDFPSPFMPDHNKNRDIIKAIVTSIASATDKADTTKIALEGHSAGGLATTLAAASIKPNATILFDPVDNADAGKAAHATLCGPVLSIFANGSSCNNSAGWFAYRTSAIGPLISFRVKGSTHCDGENADRGVACGSFCGGGADKTRQGVYGRYATAFLLRELKGDADAAKFLAGVNGDTALESAVTQDKPSCTAAMDAGTDAVVVEDTATSVEDTAIVVSDTAPVEDTRVAPADGAPQGAPSESAPGCTCSTSRRANHNGWVTLFAFLALRLRARPRR
jgi:pimeloyl-ACP methyl ester carboxylesterase